MEVKGRMCLLLQRTQKVMIASAALSAWRGHTHFVQMQRKEHLCVSITLQNNKEPFGATETTFQIFIAHFSYSVLFVNLSFFAPIF
jgi:hypothetical protein